MEGKARPSRAISRIEMERQIDKLVAAIWATLTRPAPLDAAMAVVMAASGIDGPGLAQPQIAALAAWSTDPTLTEGERNYAAAQLAALNLAA